MKNFCVSLFSILVFFATSAQLAFAGVCDAIYGVSIDGSGFRGVSGDTIIRVRGAGRSLFVTGKKAGTHGGVFEEEIKFSHYLTSFPENRNGNPFDLNISGEWVRGTNGYLESVSSPQLPSIRTMHLTGFAHPPDIEAGVPANILFNGNDKFALQLDFSLVGVKIHAIYPEYNLANPAIVFEGVRNGAAVRAYATLTCPEFLHDGFTQATATTTGTKFVPPSSQVDTTRVTLAWRPMSSTGIFLAGYHVFRSQDPNTVGIRLTTSPVPVTTTPNFTDTTAVKNTYYYYRVRPLGSNGTTYIPARENLWTLRIITPPRDSVFIHRSTLNFESCDWMTSTGISFFSSFSPASNICNYAGAVFSYTFYGSRWQKTNDFGKDLIIDLYETGCDTSAGATYTSEGCIVGTRGFNSPSLFVAEAAAVSSNRAGLPPVVKVSPVFAHKICNANQVEFDSNGTRVTYNKSLPSMKAWRAAATWKTRGVGGGILTEPQIVTMENGGADGRCNTGLSTSDLVSAAADRAPNTAYSSTFNLLRTGSNTTRNCVSRYGIQDMVGNVAEWLRDQAYTYDEEMDYNLFYTTGNVSSEMDFSLWDTVWLTFSNRKTPMEATISTIATNPVATDFNSFNMILGIPSLAINYPFEVNPSRAAMPTKLHGDRFGFRAGNWRYPDLFFAAGGHSLDGVGAGRFNTRTYGTFPSSQTDVPDWDQKLVGFRCAIEIPSP